MFKGLYGVLIVGGHENDGRRPVALRQFVQQGKPVLRLHLHVQKNQIRTVLALQFQPLIHIRRFADHEDFRVGQQQLPHPLSCRRFVVHDQSLDDQCLGLFDCMFFRAHSGVFFLAFPGRRRLTLTLDSVASTVNSMRLP